MTPPRTILNPSGRTQVGRPNATTMPPSLAQRFSDLSNYSLQVHATLNIVVFKTSGATNFPLSTWVQEATTILGQHGLVGDMRTDVDLSYLSDTILLFRFFEAKAEVRTAISVVKSRTSSHERSIREFRLSSGGLEVGEALRDFEGVLSGLPSYKGDTTLLASTLNK